MEMSSKYQKSGMFGNPSHPKSSCSSIYDIACIPQTSGQGSPTIGSLEACCFSIKSVMKQVGSNTWEAAEVHHVGCDTMLLSQEQWYTGQQWSQAGPPQSACEPWNETEVHLVFYIVKPLCRDHRFLYRYN